MIFLVRHGEAAAGWGDALDPGLSDLGHRQANAAAKQLREAGAVAAIKSPMRRCQETAAAFENLLAIKAPIDPRVSEIETPEGLSDRAAWLKTVMGGRWDEAGHDFTPWRSAALEAVRALPDGTAVFSHFIAINAIAGLLEGREDVIVFRPGHCSVTKLERAGETLKVAEWGSEAASRVL